MTSTRRVSRLAFFLLPFALLPLLAAAPPQQDSPDELIRRANELFRAGKADAADPLYIAAEERTGDPGLVAFNRAAVLFERGDFREAERHYERVLDDAACPLDRAAKAWYNRGTCLLRRGGSMNVFRSAIACFEKTIESASADEPLKADARHNLEIAKLRWIEEAKKEKPNDPPSPNDNTPPEEEKKPKSEPEKNPEGKEQNSGNETGGTTPKDGSQQVQKGANKITQADQTVAANNHTLEVPKDTDEVQNLSPEEARAWLKATADRRKRELHSLLRMLYGPDRVDVQDW